MGTKTSIKNSYKLSCRNYVLTSNGSSQQNILLLTATYVGNFCNYTYLFSLPEQYFLLLLLTFLFLRVFNQIIACSFTLKGGPSLKNVSNFIVSHKNSTLALRAYLEHMFCIQNAHIQNTLAFVCLTRRRLQQSSVSHSCTNHGLRLWLLKSIKIKITFKPS